MVTYCHLEQWGLDTCSNIYSQIPLHDITHGTARTGAESESDLRITINTAYLALTGKLWGVCCEDLGENWQRYNGTALYRAAEFWDLCHIEWYRILSGLSLQALHICVENIPGHFSTILQIRLQAQTYEEISQNGKSWKLRFLAQPKFLWLRKNSTRSSWTNHHWLR